MKVSMWYSQRSLECGKTKYSKYFTLFMIMVTSGKTGMIQRLINSDILDFFVAN